MGENGLSRKQRNQLWKRAIWLGGKKPTIPLS